MLAVQADNSQQPNSRWYSGSGIYRNVWLVKTGRIHVDLWGTSVTTPVVTAQRAEVQVETTLKNTTEEAARLQLVTTLLDPQGKQVARQLLDTSIQASGTLQLTQLMEVANPELWSTRNPAVYNAVKKV